MKTNNYSTLPFQSSPWAENCISGIDGCSTSAKMTELAAHKAVIILHLCLKDATGTEPLPFINDTTQIIRN